MNVDDFVISRILRFYHRPEMRPVTDYPRIVTLGEAVTVDGVSCMEYPCPMQTVTLNMDGYPVDTERQKVDIEKDAYFYKFTDDEDVEEDTAFEYVCPYEWKRYHPLPHDIEEEDEEEEE